MAQIATLEDFQIFRREIIEHLNELKSTITKSTTEKRWLRSDDVKKLLHISHGKLQKMRDLGQIPYRKVDGVILYDLLEIEKRLGSYER